MIPSIKQAQQNQANADDGQDSDNEQEVEPEEPAPDEAWKEEIKARIYAGMQEYERSQQRKAIAIVFGVFVVIGLGLNLVIKEKEEPVKPSMDDVVQEKIDNMPSIPEITKQSDLFKGCVADGKVGCMILFLPDLQTCDLSCWINHAEEFDEARQDDWLRRVNVRNGYNFH